MLRPRHSQLRQLPSARVSEGILASFRQFSITATRADEGVDKPPGPSRSVAPRENPTASTPRRSDNRNKIVWVASSAKAPNAEYVRPKRAIDARSLAAPRAGGQQANILRAPRLQKLRSGQAIRGRRSGTPGMAVSAKSRQSGRGDRPRRPRRQSSEEEEGDSARAAQIEEFYREQAEKENPKPVRYDPPKEYNVSMLKDTWPSLPVGETACAGSVLEKMSWMSSRYPNGYEPPHELAKRLFEGKRVLFSSQEEKTRVMEEVKKLTQERADKLTQRKGDLIEPEDTSFVPISAEERKTLFEELVQGKYPLPGSQSSGNRPVIADALRNLENNGTYQTATKSTRFLTKLESLLASGQRARRA